jgi:hypothetical protein
MPEARVFGIVTGPEDAPNVAWLERALPVTEELLAKTAGIEPQRVFRIAVACQESRCVHFDGANCKLAQRIVDLLPPVATAIPPCPIRPTCRWFAQEGRAACLRCPQVATHTYDPPAYIIRAATPA